MEFVILRIVKARLNRLDRALDTYLIGIIQAAMAQIEARGIHLREDDPADVMLASDLAVWRYQNRDDRGDYPAWLDKELRDRWIQEARHDS